MYSFPIEYIEPVFRPPSEAKSLILPVTNGCSWNQCTFCEMYTQPQKKFRARKPEDIRADIAKAAEAFGDVRRVFLADGDAMVLPTRRLLEILSDLKTAFPGLQRVSSYCLPRNLAKKSVEDLVQLREAGLGILYVGMESGDDEVLKRINKGESWESTRSALTKIREAGCLTAWVVKPCRASMPSTPPPCATKPSRIICRHWLSAFLRAKSVSGRVLVMISYP